MVCLSRFLCASFECCVHFQYWGFPDGLPAFKTGLLGGFTKQPQPQGSNTRLTIWLRGGVTVPNKSALPDYIFICYHFAGVPWPTQRDEVLIFVRKKSCCKKSASIQLIGVGKAPFFKIEQRARLGGECTCEGWTWNQEASGRCLGSWNVHSAFIQG